MTFKSHIQPLCRCCGKPIPKVTDEIYIYAEPPRTEYPEIKHEWINGRSVEKLTGKMIPIHVNRHVIGIARTKAEAQRLVNTKIVSVRRSAGHAEFIERVGVWDGESYRDEFFCNRIDCAVRYAYMVVRSPNNRCISVAYADAREEQYQNTEKSK